MRKILFPMLALLLMLCFVGCVSTPPVGGEETAKQTETLTDVETESMTATMPDTQEQPTEQNTDATTETAQEQTTYGELHFPESGES